MPRWRCSTSRAMNSILNGTTPSARDQLQIGAVNLTGVLSALPSEIGQLTALEYLILRGNQLTALPPEIGQLTALGGLDLRSNQLSALPPEIGHLRSLQTGAEAKP